MRQKQKPEPDAKEPRGLWLYGFALRAFPRAFRERHGADMRAGFGRLLMGARERGRVAEAGVWARGLWDVLSCGVARRFVWTDTTSRGGKGVQRRNGDGRETMGSVIGDARQSWRAMVRRPALYGTALLTLALGIGANTAIFSVVNALLLRPLPYRDADRLVVVWSENRTLGWTETDVSAADAWDYRSRSDVLEDLAVFDDQERNLTGGGEAERVQVIAATPNLFDVLGVRPVMGRGFTREDGRAGAPLVAVISEALRERRFGGASNGLGEVLVLDGETATVVGVMSGDFAFLDEAPQVWVPERGDPAGQARGNHDHEAIARLAASGDVASAERALNEVAARLEAEYPETNGGWTVDVQSLRDDLLGDIAKQAVLVLLGAVGFVLLMACTNVANLLLARSDGRREEMAVRRALGASRGRLLRQLMVESVVLAMLGGASGVVIGYWLERAIVSGLPDTLPPAFRFGLDATVLAYSFLVAGIAAVLSGLVPALRGSRAAAADIRRASGYRGGGGARFGGFLIVAQTSLAMVLLVGGGMMTRSVVQLARQEMGFDARGVLTLRFAAPEDRYLDDGAVAAFWEEVMAEVRSIPGVISAGAIQSLPLGGDNWGGTFWVEGQEDPAAEPGRASRLELISRGYLEAMGLDIKAGRVFAETDLAGGPGVALVTESFVRTHFPDRDVVGLRLLSSGLAVPVTVIGVVEDHLTRGIDRAPEPALLLSLDQRPLRSRAVAIRAGVEPAILADAVREAIRTVDAAVPVYDVRTMRERVSASVGNFAILAELMGGFALLSLLLGAVGIYGVTAYGVARRSAEIGVRMALGASSTSVSRLILGEGMRRLAIGLVIGTVLALVLARAMRGLLFDVSPTDPITFGLVACVLVALGLIGSWLPARRATRLDPVRALSNRG
jgi:predicted permease